MKDIKILAKFKEYFTIEELFRADVVKKYGQFAWNFLDIRLLETILIIRKTKGLPMAINFGKKRQRGLRDNLSYIVRKKKHYTSPVM